MANPSGVTAVPGRRRAFASRFLRLFRNSTSEDSGVTLARNGQKEYFLGTLAGSNWFALRNELNPGRAGFIYIPGAAGSAAMTLYDSVSVSRGTAGQAAHLLILADHLGVPLRTWTPQGGDLFIEQTDHPAPDVNQAVVFARDNGSGKTQLCVRFATGAIQVLSTEP